MTKFFKVIVMVMFFIFGLFSLSICQQEEITITTYYPSPFGSYNELRTNRLAVGPVNSMPTVDGIVSFEVIAPGASGIAGDEGDLYYDEPDHQFKYHDDIGWKPMAGVGIPSGIIVMWSGSIASIPAGWALCNGQTVGGITTPDLRDRFIVGAGASYSASATGGNTSHPHTVDIGSFNSGNIASANAGVRYSGVGLFVANERHSHTVNPPQTVTSDSSNLPPYYALCFIMRL